MRGFARRHTVEAALAVLDPHLLPLDAEHVALQEASGRAKEWPYRSIAATLDRKISSQIGRLDYARVRVAAGRVEPLAIGGASVLSSTTRADGFVVVPADSEGFGPGTEVTVWLYA